MLRAVGVQITKPLKESLDFLALTFPIVGVTPVSKTETLYLNHFQNKSFV